jgi:acyl transferase domain-containing protein
MACRLPAAPDLGAFWDLLRQGRQGVAEVSTLEDWNRQRASGLEHAALLSDVAGFDAPFFRITPREAEAMDPQQRLLMEVSWHALENAGVVPAKLRGSAAGVYVGISGSGYALHSAMSGGRRDAAHLTGALCSIAANRLSYFLGVHGPSMAVDTACSSSLVAIHLACQALAAGDADLALAGGVSLILDSFVSSTLTAAGVLSQDGRCKTFDKLADGYVRGEGAAMLVLRPLAAARRDGARIYAVIRGSAVNQDGPSNGLMAPNRAAQEMVLGRAYERAGIEPSRVDYIEAHGTGTLLGDPIEAKALGRTVGRGRSPGAPCRVGTSKTNVGHLEAAAGVTGVVKCCLMMHHESFVPSLNFEECNPYIPLERLNLAVQTSLEPWEMNDGEPRLAGVSSFGIGGTNAHVVLESPPARSAGGDATALHPLLAVSAASPEALHELGTRYAGLFEQTADDELIAICQAAATQREPLAFRAAFAAESVEEMRRELSEAGAFTRPAARRGLKIAFLFTGQGSQYPGMGSELFRREPLFRRSVERCAAVLDGEMDRPLLDVMFGTDRGVLDETVYSQPTIFALEYGLAEVWKSWGIAPAAVLGHSVGELVAACVAGVLELDDALRLVALRGQLMQESSSEGAMLAAAIGEEDALACLADQASEVELAAVNSPRQTVFTGPTSAIDRVAARLGEMGISGNRLRVGRAFHSALLDPVLPRFESGIRGFGYRAPSVPFFSNVTGGRASEEVTDPGYWVRQARSTVRFADCIGALAEEGYDALLEVGSAPILLSLARESVGAEIGGFASLRQGSSDARQMVATLGGLFALGATPDWSRFFGASERRVETLPAYPFQHRTYWLDGGDSRGRELAAPTPTKPDAQPALDVPVDDAHALVVAHLSATTGHPPSQLSPETRLTDLGLSSIELLELTVALARDCPAFGREDSGLAEARTVADIVEWVGPHVSATGTAAEFATGVGQPDRSTGHTAEESTSVELLVAPQAAPLRRDPRNRVLESFAIEDGKVKAGIIVDQSHSFFFDHPYDHVPGVLFVEAVQQLSEWLGSALGGESLRRRLQLRELGIRFESWGDLDTPLWITSESLTRKGESWSVSGTIGGERRCARFDGVFRAVELETPNERSQESPPPAGRRLVHKRRSENVLISEPTMSGDGVVAMALQPGAGHSLCDGGRECVSATQLAEWTRQFLTARAHAMEQESFEERFILLSVHVRLNAAIPNNESLALWSPAAETVDTTSLRLGESRVELRRGDLTLGQVELFGASADAREYERARWGDQA